MRGYGRSVGLNRKNGCTTHSPTSIDTDDPTFETAEHRFSHDH
jgi:hypothetical protein